MQKIKYASFFLQVKDKHILFCKGRIYHEKYFTKNLGKISNIKGKIIFTSKYLITFRNDIKINSTSCFDAEIILEIYKVQSFNFSSWKQRLSSGKMCPN
jgi:hypothetical protein